MVIWKTFTFSQLTNLQLYKILQLRHDVFTIEQKSSHTDLDNKDLDPNVLHLIGYSKDNQILAYARLLPAGLNYEQVSISRVIVASSARKQGLGQELIAQALLHCEKAWPHQDIKISAQARLEDFYKKFGFKSVSEHFLSHNIEHVTMLLEKSN